MPSQIDLGLKQMDANGNGVIDENEFSTFINSLV
jgi:Ca2+-binding EF-hand superfamily protein